MTEQTQKPLVAVRDLKVHFPVDGRSLFGSSDQVVKAVDGVTLDIYSGETFGLVGESGCGKSTLGRAILRLVEPTGGQILFRDRDLAGLSNTQMREQRRHLQVIFQDPYASLNPRMTVSQIIGEPIDTFGLARGAKKKQRVQQLMELVGLSPRFLKRYPHEFSGGQRQRIGIARALAVEPEVLLMDEPCSALDPIATARIEELILELKRDLTIVIVTHNMQQAARVADATGFFLLGELVEFGPTSQLFTKPVDKRTEDYITGRFG